MEPGRKVQQISDTGNDDVQARPRHILRGPPRPDARPLPLEDRDVPPVGPLDGDAQRRSVLARTSLVPLLRARSDVPAPRFHQLPAPLSDRPQREQGPENRGKNYEEETGAGVLPRARGGPRGGIERRGGGGVKHDLHGGHGHGGRIQP